VNGMVRKKIIRRTKRSRGGMRYKYRLYGRTHQLTATSKKSAENRLRSIYGKKIKVTKI